MNHTIKARAKAQHGYHWVRGFITFRRPVDARTVKQYVGMRDAFDKEIYEDDEVTCENHFGETIHGTMVWVKSRLQFAVKDESGELISVDNLLRIEIVSMN